MPTERSPEQVKRELEAGLELEGQIVSIGLGIREESKLAYHQGLLDARLSLLSGFALLIKAKDAMPGRTSPSISARLVLISTMVQGATATECLISEGQYAKAAAALKQDYEIIARLSETRTGTAVPGKTPNAAAAPEGSQRIYGNLNRLAHPSREALLGDILSTFARGEAQGVSPIPAFNVEAAQAFYEIHVFTLIQGLREGIILFVDMYDDAFEHAEPAIRAYVAAVEYARSAGFTVE